MVIRTGQAFIEVEKVDPAVIKIRQLAVQFGGYIANSSMSGGRDQIRQATFELKIPAARYDEAVSSLSTIGKVETVSSNAQDVGEEFVDVTARVNNARRLEERLISLLANRTGKLDEVLRVERELARVREEIERYEGRLRFLTTRVATSTLTITVHEPAPILGSNPGENPIASALRRAWRNFVGLAGRYYRVTRSVDSARSGRSSPDGTATGGGESDNGLSHQVPVVPPKRPRQSGGGLVQVMNAPSHGSNSADDQNRTGGVGAFGCDDHADDGGEGADAGRRPSRGNCSSCRRRLQLAQQVMPQPPALHRSF